MALARLFQVDFGTFSHTDPQAHLLLLLVTNVPPLINLFVGFHRFPKPWLNYEDLIDCTPLHTLEPSH